MHGAADAHSDAAGAVPAASSGVVVILGWITAGSARPRRAEVAALRVEDGVPAARLEITLEGPGGAALADLLAFLPEGATLVAHDADLLAGLWRRGGTGLSERPLLDSQALAALCHPELPAHDLAFLVQALALGASGGEGAMARAEATWRLWAHLREALAALPAPVLRAIVRLWRGARQDPLRDLLRAAAEAAGVDERRDLVELLGEAVAVRRRERPTEPEVRPLDPLAVTALLDPEGPLAQALGRYEYRDEQVRMAQAVVEAFNSSRHLLVEAGTGVGKSLAYLLPALLWAVVNESPVVVSTHTRNLQAQLVEKDLPLLTQALDIQARFAMIKGRRNYLCVRKLLYLLDHADTELESAERLPLAGVVVWAARTRTGDLTECLGDRSAQRDLAGRVSSVAEECRGMDCEHRRRCFLQRARRLAQAADVVVANHAVVFSEMANPLASPVLPPYQQLVLDEAHNLEDAVTSALSREVSLRRVQSVLSRLWRRGSRRRARGLLPSLGRQVGRLGRSAGAGAAVVLSSQAEAEAALAVATAELGPFFAAMAGLLRPGEGAVLRLDPGRRGGAGWAMLMAARARLLAALGDAARAVTALADGLVRLAEPMPEALAEFDRELRAAALWLGEFCRDAEAVLDAAEPGWVCWIEAVPPMQGGAQAWGAPIQVGALMQKHLYEARQSVVFTSATLTAHGSTAFVERRLGIDLIPPERLTTLTLGTVFDYARQALVLVPLFLPEPDAAGKDYAGALSAFLGELFRASAGRGLVLFTSHDMLRRCSGPLQRDLGTAGIAVLAQGLSGSRESLLQRLKNEPRTVVLGAQSFWEGIDVVGDNLSCVVLARLPFAVHTDPVVAARCEAIAAAGGNAFMDYTLPAAVIRFRQGFGRLIRHRRDRGVVVIADRRIVSKRYGEWFRASLPTQVWTCADARELCDAVHGFLAAAEPG